MGKPTPIQKKRLRQLHNLIFVVFRRRYRHLGLAIILFFFAVSHIISSFSRFQNIITSSSTSKNSDRNRKTRIAQENEEVANGSSGGGWSDCTCPPGSFLVRACTFHLPAVCDICHTGYCPQLSHSALFSHFTIAVNASVPQLVQPPGFGAFHPGIFYFQSTSTWYATYRVANNSHCWGIPAEDGKMYRSFIALCQLSDQVEAADEDRTLFTPLADTCRIIDIPFEWPWPRYEHLATTLRPSTIHAGAEDVRPFVYKDAVYLSGTLHFTLLPEELDKKTKMKKETARMVILKLDSSSLSTVEDVMLLDSDGAYPWEEKQKNWMPLPTENGLFIVAKFDPLIMFSIDFERKLLTKREQKMAVPSSLSQMRGSSAFIATPSGYLGLLHVQKGYGGRIPVYNHYFIMFHKNLNSIAWLSPPFRLPLAPDTILPVSSQDMQYGMSLALYKSGDVLVSYGLNDCYSMLARVPWLSGSEVRLPEVALSTPRFTQRTAFEMVYKSKYMNTFYDMGVVSAARTYVVFFLLLSLPAHLIIIIITTTYFHSRLIASEDIGSTVDNIISGGFLRPAQHDRVIGPTLLTDTYSANQAPGILVRTSWYVFITIFYRCPLFPLYL